MIDKQRFTAKALCLVLTLLLSNLCVAQGLYTNRSDGTGEVIENPSALAMAGDLVVVRPFMFTVTVVGSVAWLLGLPFSAAGGNIGQTGDTLVITPAKYTFYRCLGCVNLRTKNKVEEGMQ